eukprot:jgi/Psemu1/11845/gm1.11845_g
MGDNNDDSAMNIRHESQEEEVRRNRSSLAEPSHLSHNDENENENEDATGFETETTTGTGTSSTARTATRTSMSPPVDPQHPIEDGIGDESNTNNSHHDSLLVPESSSIDPRNATESIDPSSSSEDDGSGNDDDEDEDDDEDNNSNNDNNNYNNNYNNSDTSELIRLASAAAIRDATKMKRSDSDLSHSTTTYSNNEEEEEDDDDILEELLEEDRNQQRTGSGRPSMSLSQTYMEQASYEASLVENDGKGEGDASGPHRFRRTQLKPSGKLGRIAHRHSSQGIIDVVHGGDDDSDSNSDSNSNSDSDKHGDAVGKDAPPNSKNFTANDSDSDEAVSGAGEKRSGSVLERTKSSARNGQRQHEHEHEQQHETPRPVFPAALHTESVRASALAEVLADCGMDVDVAKPFPDPDPSQPPDETEEHEHDVFARYLYALFDGFCRPPLELDSVRKIVELERCRHRHRQSKSQSQSQSQSQSSSHDTPVTREEANVPLPVGIVVQRPSAVLINVLVGSASSPSTSPSTSAAALHSKRLPPVFASSLFRILLRLLEGYTDAQYDSCVVLASCAWQHEAATSSSSKARAQHPGRTEPSQSTTASSSKTTTTTPTKTKTTTPMETPPGSSRDDEPLFVGTTNDTAANANLVYSIARLRMQWEHSVRSVLRALTSMLTVRGYHPKKRQQQQQQQQQQEYNRRYEHLVYPMIRLLGLLCAGGVTVEELRTMISLAATVASDTTAASVATVARWVLPDTMKVLMIRALAVAASTTACNSNSGGSRRMSSTTSSSSSSSPTLVMMGKANLRTFFSFASGPGMRRTIHLDDPQQQATWPFRNDFGTAFSFRAEDFFSASPPPNSNDSSRNAGDSSCILLQALSETGSGIVISLVPLDSQKQSKQTQNRKQLEPHATKDDNTEKSMSTAAVISIKTVENHKVVDCVKVNNCPLHARVWYHIAIRHTRSRLKGVFSLSSREQMTVLLDGKQMLVEAMQFPQLRHESKSKKSLSFTVGKNFDGQIGSIYVFRDNVSDATFKAIYDRTSAEATITTTTRSGRAVDFREDNQPMRVSTTTTSRNIRSDDLEHLAFSSSGREGINRTIDTADLCEDEDTSDASNPLSKSSFISRLYLCWNPRRRENNFLMELHSGVHASLDRECVQAVCIESAQQPCLFQFISEVIENMASTMSTRIAKTEETHGTEEKDLRESPLSKGSSTAFDLSLELYSILLGHIVRNNGDKSIVALEEAAALQRVYVNGPEVFALIVSHLLENLSQLGVVPFDQQPRTNVNDTTSDQCPNLLKSNAKIVTDAILSGTKLSTAIVSWRFLKYLAMSTTAFIHCLNSNAEFHVDSQKDGITSGHFGILLPEGVVGAIEFENLMKMYTFESVGFVSNKSTSKTLPHDNLQKRLSVHIAVQMLSLLDVFIFPEDSTSDLKALELVRESEALERYSVTFNKITLPFDRLLLSSFIRSHFALQKCAKLLNEIESDSTKSKLFFANKEARKRSYRRIFRPSFILTRFSPDVYAFAFKIQQLREILMTIYEKRNGETGTSVSAQKETLVRALLASDWVQKFQMTRSRKSNSITLVHPTAESMLANESIFVQNLGKESSEIEKAYQKSLNAAFEEYLEKQRKWAETSAVRDLEFKGDTALKLFSNECKHEGTCLSKDIVELSSAAKLRWAAIERKVGNTTNFPSHSKLPTFTDQNDRQRGENGRKELNLQNELSDLMKRNHEALSSYDEILALDDDHDDARKDVGDAKEESELVGATDFSSPEIVSVDSSETDWTVDEFVPDEEIDVGGDEWAKAFIWEDNESIVAR